MAIDWIHRDDLMPPQDQRILIFSPGYPENNDLRYRIIEGQFFRHMTDATFWAYLCPPILEEKRPPCVSSPSGVEW